MKALVPLVLTSLSLVFSGCTTPCDESRDVLTRQCFLDTDGEMDAPCDGERRAFAECILDHPAAACDYFYDSVAASGNAFDLCVQAIVRD